MTQSTETVSQRAYEAAQVLFDDILGDAYSYAEFNRPSYREAAVRTLLEAFANKDETIAKLHRIVRGWSDWYRFATADDDNEYLNGKGWDDAEGLADMSIAALTSTKKEG